MGTKILFLLLTALIPCAFSQKDEENCPDNASGFYPHQTLCDSYYECRKGVSRIKHCEDGFVFVIGSPLYERCDHPFTVDCKDRPELQPAQPKGHCPRQNGLFPHSEDCGMFWQCVRGFASKHRCQGPLAFNPNKGICVWPHEVPGCEHVASDAMKQDDQDDETVRSEHCQKLTGLFPHETDCGKFWQCSQGRAVEKKCRYPLAFSVKRGICVWPQEVRGCEELAKESLSYRSPEAEDGDEADDQPSRPAHRSNRPSQIGSSQRRGESSASTTEGAPTRAPTRSPAGNPPRAVPPPRALPVPAPPVRTSSTSESPTTVASPATTTIRSVFRGRTRQTIGTTITSTTSTTPQPDYEYYEDEA